MREYNNDGIKRIDKRTAKKLYNNGKDVLFIPCNLRPDNMWGLGIWQNKDLNGQYDDFDKLVMWYSWYNCTAETGKYISFYVKGVI